MKKFSSLLGIAAGAAAAVGLVGCGALTGAPRVVPQVVPSTATPTTAGTAGASGAATAPSGGAVAGGAGTVAAGILGKVVPLPDGARAWKHNKTGVLSLGDFVDNFYKTSVQTEEMATVQRRGFVTAARHGWFNMDGTQADVFVVQFASAQGAKGMYLGVTSAWSGAGSTGTTFTDSAVHGTGQLDTTLDSIGDLTAKDATYVGDYFVYVRVFDPASANKSAVMALTQQEVTLLGGARS